MPVVSLPIEFAITIAIIANTQGMLVMCQTLFLGNTALAHGILITTPVL